MKLLIVVVVSMCDRLSPVEIAFLEEYARTLSPVAKALNILQAEIDVQMGWLLPTLTLLISKLDRIGITSRYCKPLVDALQKGLQQRFGNMQSQSLLRLQSLSRNLKHPGHRMKTLSN